MEKVLIISDDPRWGDAVAAELEAAGHEARLLPMNAIDGANQALEDLNAVVVDARGMAAVAARLAKVRRAIPGGKTLTLAALAPVQLSRLDFSAGFDDFLVDPFAAPQVVARIRQLRWRENSTDAADLLKAGDLLVNRASCEVNLRGVPLALTYQEYELLRHLMEHRGRVFTREQLLSELWGYNYYGGTRTVDVHVRRLRAKLGPEHEDLIQTVRNVGYRFARDA